MTTSPFRFTLKGNENLLYSDRGEIFSAPTMHLWIGADKQSRENRTETTMTREKQRKSYNQVV